MGSSTDKLLSFLSSVRQETPAPRPGQDAGTAKPPQENLVFIEHEVQKHLSKIRRETAFDVNDPGNIDSLASINRRIQSLRAKASTRLGLTAVERIELITLMAALHGT